MQSTKRLFLTLPTAPWSAGPTDLQPVSLCSSQNLLTSQLLQRHSTSEWTHKKMEQVIVRKISMRQVCVCLTFAASHSPLLAVFIAFPPFTILQIGVPFYSISSLLLLCTPPRLHYGVFAEVDLMSSTCVRRRLGAIYCRRELTSAWVKTACVLCVVSRKIEEWVWE